MKWLTLITLALKAVTSLIAFLRERELIEAGEAKAIAEGLEISNDRIAKARRARQLAANGGADNDNDPYLRD
jgi:hypothetical protein